MRSSDPTKQVRNVAIKVQTCRQFVDFIDPVPKSLFYPSKKKTNERKEFVAFSLSFRQTGRKVYSTRISRTFFLICKSLPSIASCISHLFHLRPNFRVLKNGRMFLDYKYRQKFECFPLVLSLKRYVVVLQAMVKKCIKAHATCKARLNHLACKNTYSLHHRMCGVRGYMHELFVSKTRLREVRASEGFRQKQRVHITPYKALL